jgi:aromatic ring hydroxylase
MSTSDPSGPAVAVLPAEPEPSHEPPIVTGEDYVRSLRGRGLRVFLFGELIGEPVDHPVIRPSINAVAETYDLALREPELATVVSPLTGERVNRFLHIAGSAADLVMQNKMQRKLGQLTGTCFQRCVGMDAFNALHSVTFEIDEQHGTSYHERLKSFLTGVQRRNQVVGGAMTDVKGDRSKAPHHCYHRRSYVCKSGVGDVLIGAAAAIAEYNGVDKASHVKDKLVEMTHLNETIYSTGIASSYQARPTKSGCYLNDDMIANVCKHHVTKMPYEIGRLAQDLAGGLMVTMPSEQDLASEEVGELLRKYLKGKADVPTETRMRILRLIENMTLGRNAVGYLTESMHGAGSPQAQRIQIGRQMELDYKKRLARRLAGIEGVEALPEEGGYFERVFESEG